MSPQLAINFLFLGVNLLMLVVAIPLMRGRIPRNRVYGMRLPKTLSSDAIWYPANRFFGEEMFKASLLSTAGNVLLVPASWLLGLSITRVASIAILMTMLPFGWAVVKSLIHLRRL